MAPSHQIPLIDISPYLGPNNETAKAKVISDVKRACTDYGFLQITGHGVPVDAQRKMIQCCKTLFELPSSEKEALSLKNNQARRGYERIGEQILDAKALPDYKEICFYIGREIPSSQAGFHRGPNQWPNVEKSDFQSPVTEYYSQMLRLSGTLLEILILALGFDTSNLATLTKEPVMNLKLLHYPRHISRDTRQFGAGEHTDFGVLTILLQQPGKEGLEVYYQPTGKWLAVPAVEDVFVVNMGDLIQKWTDGEYASTVHRVTNTAKGDRYSVPCFYEGNSSATNPFKPDEVDGETVEMHIRRKFDQSYGLAAK